MPRPRNALFSKDFSVMSEKELWEHYKACLIAHDWEHHYSDDYQVWFLGCDEASYIAKLKRKMFGLNSVLADDLYRTRGR